MNALISFVYMEHFAWASFTKFSYKYRDKSGVADIGGFIKPFRWGDYGLAIGGDFIVWFGYDVGPIQLDPIYADYFVWFGIFKGKFYLLLEHPCMHYIDRLDTLPLYWNSLRLMYRDRDFEVSTALYIHSDKYQFLSRGTDWSLDIKIFKRFREKISRETFLTFEGYTFFAPSRNYKKAYASFDMRMGLEFYNEKGDLGIFLGFRPYDRTGIIRDAEGVPYLSLRVRGF